jgi:twitching motility protein PilT
MQSFQQHLQELVQSGMVDYEVARTAAPSPSDFELAMQTLGGAAPDPTRGDVVL